MAVTVFSRYPGLSPKVIRRGRRHARSRCESACRACILHFAGESEDGFDVSRRSGAPSRRSRRSTILGSFPGPPDARLLSRSDPIEVAPLHNLFAVEMDTIERMGAVSLPATYAGAAL